MTRRKSRALRTLEPEEMDAITNAIDTRYVSQIRNSALLWILRETGMRVGEALVLKVEDVDWKWKKDVARISIPCVDGAKTGHRMIYLKTHESNGNPTQSWEALELWLTVRPHEAEYVFCSTSGKQVIYESVRRALVGYASRAGIKHPVSLHMYRHSYGKRLDDAGVPLDVIQDALGHEDISTTRIYQHADTEAKLLKIARSLP